MAAKKSTKRAKAPGTIQRARAAMSREERAARSEIQQGVKHLEKSIVEIQRGVRKAEKKIEADARVRVRELRKEARSQLAAIKAKQREAARVVHNLSAAAEGSWQELKDSADAILADARGTAASIAARVRKALGG
jgi:hypothetical protein